MTSPRALFKKQDYYKLKQECLSNGELFFDEFFEMNVPGAMWLRPKKIVQEPRFFVGGASRFDVVQGANSGCWLLVAMANLTMNPTMFNHVVPKDQTFTEDYAGIFRFNFWQCGKWVEVVIDDRLPTKEGKSGRKLMFAHSKDENEFWSSLFEKAYAKLYGSYDELTSGWFNESMVDLTGGIVERVNLQPPPDNLKEIIIKSLARSSFICAFMIDDPSVKEMVLPNGLVKGHAYGLTKAITVHFNGKKIQLVRLRNPWGKIEWIGAWSDSSLEWRSLEPEEKRKCGLVCEEDGEFWMSITDFSENFQYADICHTGPDLYGESEGKIGWSYKQFKGEWTKGVNAGGVFRETFHTNPQYKIILTDTDDDSDNLCTVLIGVLQRNKTRKVWHKIGFTAFLLDGPEKDSKETLSKNYTQSHFKDSLSSDFYRRREHVVRDAWEPGVYCIVPSTYKPDEEGQYLLRVYSENKLEMTEHEVSSDKTGHPSVASIEKPAQSTAPRYLVPRDKKLLVKSEQEVASFFRRNAGNDSEIGLKDLQSILHFALSNAQQSSLHGIWGQLASFISPWIQSHSTPPQAFSKDECRSMIDVLDDDQTGRLSWREFMILWKKLQVCESVFLHYSGGFDTMNVSDLSDALKDMGYHVKSSDVSRIVRKYADEDGVLKYADLVMGSIEMMAVRN